MQMITDIKCCISLNRRPFHIVYSENFYSFYREIDGVIYPGNVKEKEQARKQYQRAKKRGQSAGLISKKYTYIDLYFAFFILTINLVHT